MEVGLLEGIMGRFPLSGDPVSEHEGRAQSIKEHLAILLNTRRGSITHLPDYGLPESTQVSMKDRISISNFGKALEETVKKYEPRLTRVRVKSMERNTDSISDFRLGFLLEAKVIGRDARFHAFFSATGSADVEDAR
jgi:type VI secretion system protein